ncbi:hypothetical protein CBS147332_7981 [Penicillium roqueforti]|nr:hypothetical protein CBS147332_7981 [Penicillium roqueforti]KAI3108135.1 hypothetical protein CBS147331_6236 [Penicillium roqueforti]
MSQKPVSIRFEDPDAWQEQFVMVDEILENFTGTREYPSTRSLPPIIFGLELTADAIDELNALDGVIVVVQDDE